MSMTKLARRIGVGGALVLAAACGGQAFTTIMGDGGVGDATIDASGDGSSTVPLDGPSDVLAETTSADAPSDAVTISDGPSGGGDGAADAGSTDAFVPDVIEEPPPNCTGAFECVPSVPPGWSGPFEVYAAASASPPCSANFAGPAYDGNGDLIARAAECTCDCGNGTVTCSTPTISFYSQALPTGTSCTTSNHCQDVTPPSGACTTIDASAACSTILKGGSFDMVAGSPTITDGGCAPIATQAVMPTTWGISARACVSALAPGRANCPMGSVCAPQPVSPFGSALCISQTGAAPCPNTAYTVSEIFYAGVDDQRSCSSCTCGSVTGASCAATVSVSSSTNGTCSTGTIEYEAPASCDPVQLPGDYRVAVTPAYGTCAASTVTGTGAATPTGPTTFCCLP
jgi:hypothetical protein